MTTLNDFDVGNALGDGAYSVVYKVSRNEDKCQYALKKVPIAKLSEKEQQNALNEVRILASIKHKNVIAFKEAFIDSESKSICLILEYCDDRDLFQHITQHQKEGSLFDEEIIWKIFI